MFEAVESGKEREALIAQTGGPSQAEAPQPLAAFAQAQQDPVAHGVAPRTVYLKHSNPKQETLKPEPKALKVTIQTLNLTP